MRRGMAMQKRVVGARLAQGATTQPRRPRTDRSAPHPALCGRRGAGVMAYELLTGSLPFWARGTPWHDIAALPPYQLLAAVRTHVISVPRDLSPVAQDLLRRMLDRCACSSRVLGVAGVEAGGGVSTCSVYGA